jgi:uncharacterized membrane protein
MYEIEKFFTDQSRWRSVTAWSSLLSFLVLFLKIIFKIEVPQADVLINAFLGAMVALGIFNNPTSKNTY